MSCSYEARSKKWNPFKYWCNSLEGHTYILQHPSLYTSHRLLNGWMWNIYLFCIYRLLCCTSTGTHICIFSAPPKNLERERENNNLFFIVEHKGGGSCTICVCVCVCVALAKSVCVCPSQVHLHLKCFHPTLWCTKGPAISIFNSLSC